MARGKETVKWQYKIVASVLIVFFLPVIIIGTILVSIDLLRWRGTTEDWVEKYRSKTVP